MAVLALGGAGLVLGGCGDDSDAASSTTAAAAEGGSGASGYCDSLVAFNSAVFGIELDETSTEAEVKAAGEALGPIFAGMEAEPPEEVSAEVAAIAPAIDALAEGDATAFNDEATFATYSALTGKSIDACDFPNTEIEGDEYVFGGVPATIEAGTMAFTLTNVGQEEHEFILFRKADGDTRGAEEILNDPATEDQGPGEFAGAVFAPPGGQGATFTELTPGEYLMVCFIPIGGGEEGPPHFTQGMVAEFAVE